MHTVQFNAMQVSSIPFDVVRFEFRFISFYFASCDFSSNSIQSSACIQPQLSIEPAFKLYTLSRLAGLPVTSHAFPKLSKLNSTTSTCQRWLVNASNNESNWSVHRKRKWTFVLNKCSGFSWTVSDTVCKCLGVTLSLHWKTQGSRRMPFDAFSDAMSYEIYAWMKACCLPPAKFRWQQDPHISTHSKINLMATTCNHKKDNSNFARHSVSAMIQVCCHSKLKTARPWAHKRSLKAIGWSCCHTNSKSPRLWAQKRPLKAIGWACCV